MFRPIDILVVCSAIGIGFIIAGLGIVLAKSRIVVISFLTTISFLAIFISLLISFPAAIAEMIICLCGSLLYGLYQLRGHRNFLAFRRFLFRPLVAGFTLAFAGIGLLAAGSWRYDQLVMGNAEEQMNLMMKYTGWHPPFEATTVEGKTDKGNTIVLHQAIVRPQEEVTADETELLYSYEWNKRVINRSVATDVTNCHGWVFTGGKYWVFGSDVPRILEDNGYRQTRNPRAGDLIVYYKPDHDDVVDHTGIVRAVGTVTMVESKWGWMGVYLHAADATGYGTNFKYYHTSRTGHQLISLRPEDAVIQTRFRNRFN